MCALLPSRSDPPRFNARCPARFDPGLYCQRNVIERAVGHLKDKRAVGTRYDKLAVKSLAMVQVALICSYLRHLHPSDWAYRIDAGPGHTSRVVWPTQSRQLNLWEKSERTNCSRTRFLS